jgi:iron complex outermembrane receptor protein
MNFRVCASGVIFLTVGSLSPLSAADVGSANTATLEEVVVTAQKREENLQTVAVSVTALSGDTLTAENRTRLDEILQDVPGVQMQNGFAGFVVNIRGVTNNVPGVSDYPTAIYVDGVYNQVEIENRAAFIDLNRAEVLRGPQGTLYGGNALGGAVNLISNQVALDKFGADGQLTVGNYGLIGGQAVLNAPFSETTGIRAVFASENRNGYLSTGQDDSVYSFARLKYRYHSSESFDAEFAVQYTRIGGQGPGTIPSPYPQELGALPNPWLTPAVPVQPGDAPFSAATNSRFTSYRANLRWTTAAGTVTFIPALTNLRQDQLGAGFGFPTVNLLTHNRTQLEARMDSPTDSKLKWTAGVYHLNYDTPFSISFLTGGSFGQKSARYDENALYGQITFPVNGAFRLTAGARYSSDEKKQVDFQDFGGVQTLAQHVTNNKLTWKAGFEYDAGQNHLIYANASTGFRAAGIIGGRGDFATSRPPPVFDAEELTAYEFGSKNQFLNGRAQLNGDVFYYKYKNYQIQNAVIVNGLLLSVAANAEGVNTYGSEIESQFLLSGNDRLSLSLAYLHGTFGVQEGDTANFNINGTDIDHAPKANLRAAYQHSWSVGTSGQVNFGVDANYISQQKLYFDTDCNAVNTPCLQQAHTVWNAQLSYDSNDDRWRTTAYIRNIGNLPVANSGSPGFFGGPGNYTIGPPRTFGLTIAVKTN